MRYKLIILVCLIALGCRNADKKNAASVLPVIPNPVSSVLLKDSFLLTGQASIIVDGDSASQNTGIWLQTFLQRSTGYKNELRQMDSATPSIHLSLNKQVNEEIGDEGYRLVVHANNILITANKSAGLFYGVQTLLQLLPPQIESATAQQNIQWKIPCVEITDHPRFKWRGVMLDVSRHFFPVSDVKKLINEMARYKFNTLHLHLTDDNGWRIEIKSLPALTKTGAWRVVRTAWWGTRQPPQDGETATYGGFYSQEEIKELVSYASSLSVNIIPEIDVPGHCLAAIASYKDLSCTKSDYKVNPGSKFYGTDDNALCPGNDSTYAFLEKVFTEVADLFPYAYIHAGGDEVYREFWNKCPVCKQKMQTEHLKDAAELQSYFFKRLKKILNAKGKKLIGWDEMLDGGFSEEAAIMNWRNDARTSEIIKTGHAVIAAPQEYTYLDHYQGDPAAEKPSFDMLRFKKVYAFEPVPAGVDEHLVLGGQANLWAEFIPEFSHAEYMLWPRAFALSEIFWSSKERQSWPDFIKRTTYQLQRLKYAGVNYSSSYYDAIAQVTKNKKDKIEIRLDTEIDSLKIYYTFSDKDPDLHSKEYKKGEVLIFPDSAAFCRVVTYKNNQQAGKVIVLPLYELKNRVAEK